MRKLLIFCVTFLVLMIIPCYSIAKNNIDTINYVKSLYNQAFEEYVNNAYTIKRVGKENILIEKKNNKLFLQKMAEKIENEALKKDLDIEVSPYNRNIDKILKNKVSKLFIDKFNPNAKDIIGSRSNYMGLLTFNGEVVANTRFNTGELNRTYFNKLYIVATMIEVKKGRRTLFKKLNDKIMWKVCYVKQPYLSTNKHLRKAQLASANLDFTQAYTEYELGKRGENAQKVLSYIKDQENIIRRIERNKIATKENIEYWKKQDALRAKKNNINALIAGLESANKTLSETNRIIAENNLYTVALTQQAKNTKKIDKLNQDVNNLNKDNKETILSDSAYKKQLNALNAMNNSYIERQALYKIRFNLTDLYEEKEEGKVFRNTINKDIKEAEKSYNKNKEYFEKLISNEQHKLEVDNFINKNPKLSKTLNLGVRTPAIEQRYKELKNKYNHFYLKNQNLYK